MNTVLITGGAGFIGFHLTKLLVKKKLNIISIDNLNNYYDVSLKHNRLKQLGISKNNINTGDTIKSKIYNNLTFIHADIVHKKSIEFIINNYKIDFIINLAAQAGVRYSIENPEAYIQTNIIGFFNVIEAAHQYGIKKIIYASSSSVYGNESESPFSESQNVNAPESVYAATKICNELLSHSYAKIYGISFIGLRFFTVYGPWGRPDMAYFKFTDAITKNNTINVYNNGDLFRDFTYIDDIGKSIDIIFDKFNLEEIKLPYSEVFNIGGGPKNTLSLLELIKVLEKISKRKVKIKFGKWRKFVETNADTNKLFSYINFKPEVSIQQGLQYFIDWYKVYSK